MALLFWKVEQYRQTSIIIPLPQSREDALRRRFRFITPLPRLAAHNLTSFALLLCWANEKNSFEILLKVTKWKQKIYIGRWIIYWKQIAKWPWAGTLVGIAAHGITSFFHGHLNSASVFQLSFPLFIPARMKLEQVITWLWWNQSNANKCHYITEIWDENSEAISQGESKVRGCLRLTEVLISKACSSNLPSFLMIFNVGSSYRAHIHI